MVTVVLGAAGQLGRDLCPLLPGTILTPPRAELELSQQSQVEHYLQAHKPSLVINCAAYNLVDQAEKDPEAAWATNSLGVRHLAMASQSCSATLVHFSTDYVFGMDRNRRHAYGERDCPGPVSLYGLSKLAGEHLVQIYCQRHYIIRTCGLYGHWGSGGKGGNFIETMLRLASQGRTLRVVNDQICTPSSTQDVAKATVALLQTGAFGLYHITNGGSCTWYDFACEIFRLNRLQPDLSPITSQEFGAPARRPSFSVLGHEALLAAGIASPRPWQEALAAYLVERQRKTNAAAQVGVAATP